MFYKIVNGAVSRGAETILERVDFEIRDREKIAVVGRNGCGKTTLLRAILGEFEMEQGTGEEPFSVTHAGEPTVGYMRQTDFEDESVTLLDEVKSVFAPLLAIEKRLKELEAQMTEAPTEAMLAEYSELHEEYERRDGYTYKKEYETMLKKFGFTEDDKAKRLSEFSGGQRTRIAFCKLLLSKPDILLLDEPTSHLDIETIRWLEDYLQHYRSAVVVVSHDRMFLDKIVGVVYEIEYGETKRYTGNYATFERQKRENYQKQCKDYAAQQAEIARLTRLVERFRYKPTKAAMAQSKLKQIERMVKIDAPDRYDLRTFHAEFQPEEDSVKKVLSVTDLSIGYDTPLATLNFEVMRGEKVGVIGKNGIGKSTLLKTLVGDVEPLSGRYEFGVRAKIGYFDQQQALRGGTQTVLDDFCAEFPQMLQSQARTALGAFQFCGDDVFKPLDALSGGERVRLALCKILRRRPNVLILDEPTNHMDIVGKETLENMLSEYAGTIVFVSHDRYFVKKCADRLIVFDDGVSVYPFGYDEYEQTLREQEETPAEKQVAAKSEKGGKKGFTTPLKELSRLQKRVEKLEKDIAAAEAELARLEAEATEEDVLSDYVRLSELGEQQAALRTKIDEMTDEWATASEQLADLA